MRMARWWVVASATAAFMGWAGGAAAASFTYDDPRCSNFTVQGTGPSYTLNCTFIAQPACQLKAVPANPTAGTSVTLIAACSGNPYGWVFKKGASPTAVNTPICGTHSASCTDAMASPGTVYYSVYGGNGSGAGPVALVTVTYK